MVLSERIHELLIQTLYICIFVRADWKKYTHTIFFSIPLFLSERCGWLLTSFGTPCVAHRVCAIPTWVSYSMSKSSLSLSVNYKDCAQIFYRNYFQNNNLFNQEHNEDKCRQQTTNLNLSHLVSWFHSFNY